MATITTPAASFAALFNQPGLNIKIEGYNIEEPVVLDSTFYSNNHAIIKDCTFKNTFYIDGVSLGKGIEFLNCNFSDAFAIGGLTAAGHIMSTLDFKSVLFRNCDFRKFFVGRCNLERGIKLISCKVNEDFEVKEVNIPNGSLHLERSNLSRVEINLVNAVTGLSINDCTITGGTRVTSVTTTGSISLIKNTFEEMVYVWGGEMNGITLNKGTYNESVRIEGVKNIGILTVHQDQFLKTLQIDNEDLGSDVRGKHREIHLDACSFGSGFTFNAAKIECDKVTILCSKTLAGTFRFKKLYVKQVGIKYDNHHASLKFTDCEFGKLEFNDFNNHQNLSFASCKAWESAESEFLIISSDLGKAQFQDFYFDSFKKVVIEHSFISNIETSGMHWFKDSALQVKDEISPSMRKKEIYRQLKQASEKQNDKFQALVFQAFELKTFKQEIFTRQKFWSNDGLVLWLGQTNDYGLNWKKPLWLLIIFSTILYFPIIISASPKLVWSPACNITDVKATFAEFKKFVYLWPQLYNPARSVKQSFNDDVCLNFGVYFFDAIQRIVLAFLLVQLVSAFRKFFKS